MDHFLLAQGNSAVLKFYFSEHLIQAAEEVQERHVLAELKIPLKAQDTGLNYGRTVILDCETGDYIIKAVGKEQKVI